MILAAAIMLPDGQSEWVRAGCPWEVFETSLRVIGRAAADGLVSIVPDGVAEPLAWAALHVRDVMLSEADDAALRVREVLTRTCHRWFREMVRTVAAFGPMSVDRSDRARIMRAMRWCDRLSLSSPVAGAETPATGFHRGA